MKRRDLLTSLAVTPAIALFPQEAKAEVSNIGNVCIETRKWQNKIYELSEYASFILRRTVRVLYEIRAGSIQFVAVFAHKGVNHCFTWPEMSPYDVWKNGRMKDYFTDFWRDHYEELMQRKPKVV